MGVVPRGDGSERIEAADPAVVLGVDFFEVVLVPQVEDEAGAVAGPQSAPGRLWRVQLRDAAAGIMD